MRAKAGNAEKASDIAGKPQPVAGKYHVAITHVNDSRTKKDGSRLDCTIFEMEALAGTVPGQEGKELVMYARLGENGEENDEYCGVISRLALACGVLKPKEERDIQAEEFENCQCVVEWESYIGKDKKEHFAVAKFGLGTWGVNDAEVADVPKNLDALRIWREETGQGGGGSGGATGAAPSTGGSADTSDI